MWAFSFSLKAQQFWFYIACYIVFYLHIKKYIFIARILENTENYEEERKHPYPTA